MGLACVCVYFDHLHTWFGFLSGRHIFGSQTSFKSRIIPLALHLPPVDGRCSWMLLFFQDIGAPDQGASGGSTICRVDCRVSHCQESPSNPNVPKDLMLLSIPILNGNKVVLRPHSNVQQCIMPLQPFYYIQFLRVMLSQ